MDKERMDLLVCQLRHTEKLLRQPVAKGVDTLSDDQTDYLKSALRLSYDLMEESTGGPYVDKSALRTQYATDGICPEIMKLIE